MNLNLKSSMLIEYCLYIYKYCFYLIYTVQQEKVKCLSILKLIKKLKLEN